MVTIDPKLKVERIRVDDLVPYAGNAKEHHAEDVDAIAASIEQFGMCDPIGAWHDGDGSPVIVEGHGRLLALKQLGYEHAPVIFLDHLDDDARRAYTHVHNQTTLNTGFDMSMLEGEMIALPEFEWGDFGFDWNDAPNWFESRERGDTSREEGNDEYNEFLEKFELKKTTDDCYTPDVVYDAVADWVAEEYGLDRSKFVRPFYPGGDYENEKYPDGSVVVDNPPFSLEVKIIRFYQERGIPFFIFAPTLTLFSGRNIDGICYIATNADITYENGAKVNTSFITNLDAENVIRTAPTLSEVVKVADEKYREEITKPVNLKYKYPPYVCVAAIIANWSSLGVDFKVPRGHAYQVGRLDAQKPYDKAIYGSGFLLSEKAKAEAEKAKAEAEKAKALEAAKALGEGVEVEPDGSVVWTLSEREMEIVASLG